MTAMINTISTAFDPNRQLQPEKVLAQLTEMTYLKQLCSQKLDRIALALQTCMVKLQKQGVHSTLVMKTGGFHYTGKEDTALCKECQLEVSGWTVGMNPFTIHAQRSPKCPYVQSMLPGEKLFIQSTTNLLTTTLELTDDEKPIKRQKTEAMQEIGESNTLIEIKLVEQMRKRTFSHWPHRTSPSSAQMIESGFFNCNVGDRVICIYCNLICQQWVPNSDDPWEAHKLLSPKCPYVIASLKRQQISSIRIVNEQSTRDNPIHTTDNDPFRLNEIVYTTACHPTYIEIPRRHASFATWPDENSPSVDDLVKAGFFYTGTKTIVTCFYCNGSLQNWGAKDNPTIEHARWFPHCAYAKQLCGAELYRKIQESKRAQQERARKNDFSRQDASGNNNSGRGQLNIPDKSTLSRLVATRLDLPISQSMLDRNYKLSIIKRCWKDQLRLKHDDFTDDCDLFMACIILQKQIERIDGKKENIIIPSAAINKIRKREQAAIHGSRQAASTAPLTDSSNNTDVEMSSTSHFVDASPSSNLCGLCFTEEKRLACIPCGHLVACVPCGHSIRSCPICRRGIDAFVLIQY